MGAVYFYHLTRASLEETLPMLLGKCHQARWRVVVRGTSADRMTWLDSKLWLGNEAGFLPHGLSGGDFDGDQPVLLTTTGEMQNQPACLMLVDGAQATANEVKQLERTCVLFDGNDPVALEDARDLWKLLTGAGCAAQYWSQDSGTWVKKAESDP